MKKYFKAISLLQLIKVGIVTLFIFVFYGIDNVSFYSIYMFPKAYVLFLFDVFLTIVFLLSTLFIKDKESLFNKILFLFIVNLFSAGIVPYVIEYSTNGEIVPVSPCLGLNENLDNSTSNHYLITICNDDTGQYSGLIDMDGNLIHPYELSLLFDGYTYGIDPSTIYNNDNDGLIFEAHIDGELFYEVFDVTGNRVFDNRYKKVMYVDTNTYYIKTKEGNSFIYNSEKNTFEEFEYEIMTVVDEGVYVIRDSDEYKIMDSKFNISEYGFDRDVIWFYNDISIGYKDNEIVMEKEGVITKLDVDSFYSSYDFDINFEDRNLLVYRKNDMYGLLDLDTMEDTSSIYENVVISDFIYAERYNKWYMFDFSVNPTSSCDKINFLGYSATVICSNEDSIDIIGNDRNLHINGDLVYAFNPTFTIFRKDNIKYLYFYKIDELYEVQFDFETEIVVEGNPIQFQIKSIKTDSQDRIEELMSDYYLKEWKVIHDIDSSLFLITFKKENYTLRTYFNSKTGVLFNP